MKISIVHLFINCHIKLQRIHTVLQKEKYVKGNKFNTKKKSFNNFISAQSCSKDFLRKEFCGFVYLCVFVFVCISASVYLSLICHFWKCAHICLTIQNICKTPVPYVSNLTKYFEGNVLIIVLVLSIVATLHCGSPPLLISGRQINLEKY